MRGYVAVITLASSLGVLPMGAQPALAQSDAAPDAEIQAIRQEILKLQERLLRLEVGRHARPAPAAVPPGGAAGAPARTSPTPAVATAQPDEREITLDRLGGSQARVPAQLLEPVGLLRPEAGGGHR